MTVREFLRERRLAAAAALLAKTEERISIISRKVGFADVSNFNHAFRRRFGMSPRQYRERANDEAAYQTKDREL
jgi:AraC-like DNA-binding protein